MSHFSRFLSLFLTALSATLLSATNPLHAEDYNSATRDPNTNYLNNYSSNYGKYIKGEVKEISLEVKSDAELANLCKAVQSITYANIDKYDTSSNSFYNISTSSGSDYGMENRLFHRIRGIVSPLVNYGVLPGPYLGKKYSNTIFTLNYSNLHLEKKNRLLYNRKEHVVISGKTNPETTKAGTYTLISVYQVKDYCLLEVR